jgi:hypothetical protein
MPKRHLLNCLSLSLIAAFSSDGAWALGFERATPAATLGAPLNFAVGVRSSADENLNADCVSAEVWVGETPLSRSNVSAALEGPADARVVRVRTFVRVEEPVVTVAVTAGCEAKVSRRFTLFADPVGVTAGMPAPMPAVEPVMMGAAPAAVPVPGTARATPTRAAPATQAPRKAAPELAQAKPRQERRVPAAGLPVARPSAAKAQSMATAAPVVRALGSGTGARLRLDAPAVTYAADKLAAEAAARREEALAAMRAAVGMAQAAANAASSRVSSMEASVESLKRESQANREAMAKLQQSLAQSDERGRWTPFLLAALLGMLGLTGWMYTRVKRAESMRQKEWWNSAHGALDGAAQKAASDADDTPKVPDAEVTPPVRAVVPAAQSKPPAMTPARSLDEADPTAQKSAHELAPLPAGFVVPETQQRDVKIEELLDVEQQAEFFVVLGQDEAAVDLLMGHLRSTGGASPLPYLKLLEIYHRRGDQTSYERMRRRFNDRFNATAPEWASGLHSGRSLQDYPDVMAAIESTWRRPAEAMATLEPLLFRTDAQDLFDLPAYRDVLFLFTLARDLKEMPQESRADDVDLFLPLAQGGGGFALTGPSSLTPELTAGDGDGEGQDGLTLSLTPQASDEPTPEVQVNSLPELGDGILTFRNSRT